MRVDIQNFRGSREARKNPTARSNLAHLFSGSIWVDDLHFISGVVHNVSILYFRK